MVLTLKKSFGRVALNLLILGLLCYSNATFSAPLELKGIPLGISESELIQKYAGLTCKDTDRFQSDRRCSTGSKVLSKALATLAGKPVKSWEFYLTIDKGLASAYAELGNTHLDTVVDAITEKYGPPRISSTDNFLEKGTVYYAVTRAWIQGSLILSVWSRGNADSFHVSFSDSDLGGPSKESAARKKKSVKDL